MRYQSTFCVELRIEFIVMDIILVKERMYLPVATADDVTSGRELHLKEGERRLSTPEY